MTDFRTGLMSVTFRDKRAADVVELARDSGLGRISWSGDVHVRPGELDTARRLRALVDGAGLETEAYASYWRADADFDPMLTQTAEALGAPRIRIWAGETGSADVDNAGRTAVARRIAALADHAAGRGIALHLEFHRNTLTDTGASTQSLLAEIAALRTTPERPVKTYWQPRPGITAAEAQAEIALLWRDIEALHVFFWDAGAVKLPLESGRGTWLERLGWFAAAPRLDLMLEFVAGGSVQQFRRDAAELNSWPAGIA